MDKYFASWALVEMLDGSRYAGQVTSDHIGSAAVLRIEVPAAGDLAPFLNFIPLTAIAGIFSCSPEVAKEKAAEYARAPFGSPPN